MARDKQDENVAIVDLTFDFEFPIGTAQHIGVGPNVDCSRNRTAATCEIGCGADTTSAVTVEDAAAPGSGLFTTMLTVPICAVVAVPEACNSVGEI